MSFILFIFVFALVIVLMILSFGISLLRSVLSIFFPSLRRRASAPFGQSQSYYGESHSTSEASNKKKIIDPNEGDYAEYEEIKN
ncbi:MAG: DUF4834 family protein [Bacteroidales bacterium]